MVMGSDPIEVRRFFFWFSGELTSSNLLDMDILALFKKLPFLTSPVFFLVVSLYVCLPLYMVI